MEVSSRCSFGFWWLALGILSAQPAPKQFSDTPEPGIVVESIAQNSEGLTAGIKEGDVLLGWKRGDARGEIRSPFELSTLEVEQAPRGTVTLEGLRGVEKKTWTLGPDTWGIQARPNFLESLLSTYSEGWELASSGKRAQAEERWRALASQEQSSMPQWLRPWLFLRIAEMQGEARQWKESDRAYQEALQSAASAGPEIQSHLLRTWSGAFARRGDWGNAERYFQEAAEKTQKFGSETLALADAFDGIGLAAHQRGDLAKSEKSYSQALYIQQRLAPASLKLAKTLSGLGNVAAARDDSVRAEEYLHEALAIEERLAPDGLGVARTLSRLGFVAWNRSDLDKAEVYHFRALAIRERLVPNTLEMADSLSSLGFVAWRRGDLSRAEEYHNRDLAIRERLLPDSLNVAWSLNALGLVALSRWDLEGAERNFRRALAIREKLAPGTLDVAWLLNNLGDVALSRGDMPRAERYSRQALAIEEKLAPGSIYIAGELENLAFIAWSRGDLIKAEQYDRQALAIEEKAAPGGLAVANTLVRLGDVFRARDDLIKAEDYYRQSLSIREKLAPGSLEVAECLNSLGAIQWQRHAAAKATGYYDQALTIREKIAPGSMEQAETLGALAGIMRQQGKLNDASRLFQKALDALESQTRHLGGSEDVRSRFRADHTAYYRAYVDLLIVQSKPDLAFKVLERSRARTLLDTLTTAHIDIHNGADPELIAKERSLQAEIEAKSNRRIRLLGEKDSGGKIKAVEREISGLTAEYQDVEAQIRTSGPIYAALTQPQTLSAEEIQTQLLDPETLLLEYSLGEDRSHLFLVSTHSLGTYELPKRSAIERAAQRVYDLLTTRNLRKKDETSSEELTRLARDEAGFSEAALKLSRMLFGPVATQLARKRLLIVSDGALHYVPFAALPMPQNKLVPLAAQHEIVNLPSASVLAVLRRERMARQPGAKTVAVLADPVFDAGDIRVKASGAAQRGDAAVQPAGRTERAPGAMVEDQEADGQAISTADLTRSAADLGWKRTRRGEVYFPRLHFSRREAGKIAATAPAGESFEALDFKASRATATSPTLANYRIVHFATHALLNSKHPELSGLVLSLVDERGKPQNGFLDLQDIYNLNLPADLVVLSACETGLGKQVSSEGLIGLTRGFMYAGASRVMASLWKIDDRATAELMGHFYRAMLGRRMTPAAALRSAQLRMRNDKRWSSPYFWAAFQIQGEWK